MTRKNRPPERLGSNAWNFSLRFFQPLENNWLAELPPFQGLEEEWPQKTQKRGGLQAAPYWNCFVFFVAKNDPAEFPMIGKVVMIFGCE
ncbi:MAG: hypothetical protein ISR85_05875 [Kiritimatiellales bacterium]|nr:hypothetical protein [Kiritimatiellota bacterium]MBL7012439.1 hypothetical protein [Kiritimatiellales bacterium]